MHVWTETPVTAIWEQLRYFTAAANVRNLLTGTIKSRRQVLWPAGSDTDARADEIAAAVAQADEYFQSARSVGLATRPLLQFYGAEALAKATIIAADREASLQGLKYHGLGTRASTASLAERDDLQDYADTPARWTVEDEYAVGNLGVFPNFARVMGDPEPPSGAVFRFREVVRILPDLAQAYERYYGESSHCIRLYELPRFVSGEAFLIHFTGVELGTLRTVFPEFSVGFEEDTKHEQPGFRSLSTTGQAPTFGRAIRHSVAGHYFVRPISSGVSTPVVTLFIASFIASNIVRYKPAFWMRILEGRSSGSATMVEMMSNLMDRRFPHDVLESLWNERFTFGSPGYLA